MDLQKSRVLKFNKSQPFIYSVSNIFVLDDVNKQVSVCRRDKQMCFPSVEDIECKWPNGRSISLKKYNDLCKMLDYIPEAFRNFYVSLKHDKHETAAFPFF